MAVALTDPGIRALPPRAVRYEVRDASTAGLCLRVWPNGTKKWSAWHRLASGKIRRVALGTWPGVGLAEARKKARAVRTTVEAGADPRPTRGGGTVEGLLDAFVKDQSPRWRTATREGWERYIKADIKPGIGHLAAQAVTPDDIANFVARLKRQRGPVSVARCFEVVRRVFRWAAATRRIPTNPCSVLLAADLVPAAQVSTRVFDDVDLVAILAASACTPLRLLVPWILYTAARGGEARAATWRQIDGNLWTVPAEESKTGHAHRVPLSTGAVAVLDELRGADKVYLFPGATASGHLERSSAHVAKVARLAGVPDFGLHRLRRTVRQRLADAGVAPHVGESCLGHLPAQILRTYTPNWEPLDDMRDALEEWCQTLHRIAKSGTFNPQVVAP